MRVADAVRAEKKERKMKRKPLMKSVAAAALIVVALGATCLQAETRTWAGWRGQKNWSDAANWEGGLVPSGTDRAFFPRSTHTTNHIYQVTPPADFAGTIVCSNYTFAVANSYLSRYFSPILELTVPEGAQWTVSGNGHVLATEGIGDRLGPDFTGELEVRMGTSFTAPATLNPSVKLIGAGALTLASASQLEQAATFIGPITILSGNVNMSDPALLAGRDISFANGGTVSLDSVDMIRHGRVGEITSFSVNPGGWSYCGGAWNNPYTSHTLNQGPPYVENGKLILTDDPAQVHAAFYTNRVFRFTEDMEFSFTWEPLLPKPSKATEEGRNQVLSCNFDIIFQGRDPVPPITTQTSSGTFNRSAQVSGGAQWGFGIYFYKGDQQAFFRWVTSSTIGAWSEGFHDQETGFDVHKAIDFTVAKKGRCVTVTMVQDGKSVSFVRDFSTALSVCEGGGYYIGFAGTSDTWGSNSWIPWSRQEISNFRGWYRDPLEGGWEVTPRLASFNSITADDYTLQRISWASTPAVTNVGAACFLPNGMVEITPAACSNSFRMMSNATITDRTKPLKFSWEIDHSEFAYSGSGHGISFLLLGSDNQNNSNGYWPVRNSYGYGTWCYGFYFSMSLVGSVGRFYLDHLWYQEGGSNPGNSSTSGSDIAWIFRNDASGQEANRKFLIDFVYDPRGRWKVVSTTRPPSVGKNGQTTSAEFDIPAAYMPGFLNWRQDTARKSRVGIRSSCGDGSFTGQALKKFSLMELTTADAGRLPGALRVPAGVTTSFKAGEQLSGQTSRVVTLENVALANGATLNVAPSNSATKVGLESVAVSGAATLAASAGATVEVEDLVLTGTAGQASLTTGGGVSFPAGIKVTIPDAWQESGDRIVLVDGSSAAGSLPVTARIVTATGTDVTDKAHFLVQNGVASICFASGTVIIVR